MSHTPIWFHTFGCKANQYDTERMRQELESRGADASGVSRARVAVINTCTVTNQADADARHMIRRLRRRHPHMTILVAGCSAALRECDYRAMPEVDAVVPGQDPVLVARALTELDVIDTRTKDVPGALRRCAKGTRGWLKVQDGCDRKCSFCATRLARGASRSRPVDEIVREAERLAEVHPELVVTGIHIGHYGRDLRRPSTLARLCETLLERVPVRLRLSSIEATEIDDRMEALLVESSGRLAPHLHVPMQSGSDRILRFMRRWHTSGAYRRRLSRIAGRMPRLGLGADVIVGFPGEGEAEFAETRSLVEELPYTYLHVFPFSARDGTEAAALPERVRGDVAAARSRVLREIALEKGRRYRAARAGEVADVVAEGAGAVTGGLTGDYLRVEIRGDGVSPGDRLTATLEAEGEILYVRPRGPSATPAARSLPVAKAV